MSKMLLNIMILTVASTFSLSDFMQDKIDITVSDLYYDMCHYNGIELCKRDTTTYYSDIPSRTNEVVGDFFVR